MFADDAFLAAIRAHPEDDGPRLVYADWLDELGDPRGEFIRAHIEAARRPVDDPARETLRARAQALLTAHAREWLGPRPGLSFELTFRRGFLEQVPGQSAIDAQAFLREADWVRRWLVGPVSLNCRTDGDALLKQLAACPMLVVVGTLHCIRAGLGDAGLVRLAAAAVDRLEKLVLSDNRLGPVGAAALARSPLRDRCRALDLGGNPLGNAGAAALAGAGPWPRLSALNLSRTRLTRAGLAALLREPLFPNLRILNLRYNPLGSAGARVLLDSPALTDLQWLHLRATGLGPDVRRALRDRFGRTVTL